MEDIPWMDISNQPESLIDVYPRSHFYKNIKKEDNIEPGIEHINYYEPVETIELDELNIEKMRRYRPGDLFNVDN